MAVGLEEDEELGAALGKLEEPAKAELKEVAPEADPEDDFSAWIAETGDVAAAAGDSPLADVEADPPTRQAEEEPEVQEVAAAEAVGDVGDPEPVDDADDPDADDAAALLLAMAPKEAEAERQVARSFLLRSRGVGRAVEPAATAPAAVEDVAEVEEAVVADAEAAIMVEEADEPRIGGAVETPDEVKAALAEELRLLEQEDSGDEPELVEEVEPEATDAEMGDPEPEEAVPLPATPEAAGSRPAQEGAEWDAEEEAGEYDPEVLLAAANAEVWDVDELDAQAEVFGAAEATREKAPSQVKDSAAEPEVAKGSKSPVAARLDSGANPDEEAAPEEAPRPVMKLQPKPKCQLKRSAPAAGAGPAAPKAKAARRQEKPSDGRPLDLKHVVVNFLDVGRAYARSQTKEDAEEEGREAFDWEGVRSCVQCLASEHSLQVLGVMPEGFEGEDSWSDSTCGLPEDIRAFCESVEEAPSSSSSSCSVRTVVRAHRGNCRFVDSEGLHDYSGGGLDDVECQEWLARCQEKSQVLYSFDAEIGAFTVAEGCLSKAGSAANEPAGGAGS